MAHADPNAIFRANLEEQQRLTAAMAELEAPLAAACRMVETALLGGRKVLACGNGGSAADAAHFTAELAGRYRLERPGYPAIDLTANHALTTALANDYPPEEVFARAVGALGAPGDVLVVFSTSGRSANVRRALEAAPARRIQTLAFLGRDGGACLGIADVVLRVPHETTARIQEAHLLLYHTLCEIIDPALAAAAG